MADVEAVIPVVPGDPRPLDGLCPRCLLPSLVEVDMVALTGMGATLLGSWIGCAEENCAEGTD